MMMRLSLVAPLLATVDTSGVQPPPPPLDPLCGEPLPLNRWEHKVPPNLGRPADPPKREMPRKCWPAGSTSTFEDSNDFWLNIGDVEPSRYSRPLFLRAPASSDAGVLFSVVSC